MTERLFSDVLARAWGDFEPERPDRPPWAQPSLRTVQVAHTDNRAVVPLQCADRAQLRNLHHPSGEQDDLEPTDWMAVGWATTPPA